MKTDVCSAEQSCAEMAGVSQIDLPNEVVDYGANGICDSLVLVLLVQGLSENSRAPIGSENLAPSPFLTSRLDLREVPLSMAKELTARAIVP